jgi:hypothetical protein
MNSQPGAAAVTPTTPRPAAIIIDSRASFPSGKHRFARVGGRCFLFSKPMGGGVARIGPRWPCSPAGQRRHFFDTWTVGSH